MVESKEMKRALRRHHKNRIKKRWRRLLSAWGWDKELVERYVTVMYENIPVCYDPYERGNPRRRGEVTLQEKRMALNEKEWE